jgi:dTDP-glucose pyrophosphorylase
MDVTGDQPAMPPEATIVLCAGAINFLDLPIATNRSNAMVPVSGKPVIAWILDDLIAKQIARCTIVLRAENQHLRRFVERSYGRRLEISLVDTESKTINESLLAGLGASPGASAVRVVLGDTLIRDPFEIDGDYLYAVEVESSRKWCLVRVDDDRRIVEYIDKQAGDLQLQLGAAGFYCLADGPLFASCVEQAVSANERELSDVLRRYGADRPIRARTASEWFDFGHIEALVDARHRLITPRYFNSMRVDPLLKTITKVSENDAKLRDERDWYRDIPDRLKVLSPRILKEEEVGGRLQITQEYYGYPTLAELYLYGDLQLDTWRSILRYVLRIHGEFRKHTGSLGRDHVRYMYEGKIEERVAALRAQGTEWEQLLRSPTLRLNGETIQNLPGLTDQIRMWAHRLADNAEISVMHGDLCFSNILFDINNQILRLIDPRGSFSQKGIYGDPRYDVAKLRHSASGFYDYIVGDLFSVEVAGDEYSVTIHHNESARGVPAELDRLIEHAGWSLDEIRVIEALLFLSMVPLHRDHPRRQLVMYLTGLKLLNDVLALADRT